MPERGDESEQITVLLKKINKRQFFNIILTFDLNLKLLGLVMEVFYRNFNQRPLELINDFVITTFPVCVSIRVVFILRTLSFV